MLINRVPVTGCWRTDTGCQEAILWTATVMPLCFWIIMFALFDSRYTTRISVGSKVSLAACWARTDITPACSSDRVPRHPRLSPCESVHRTPTMDGFFIVPSKCCSKVASISSRVVSFFTLPSLFKVILSVLRSNLPFGMNLSFLTNAWCPAS